LHYLYQCSNLTATKEPQDLVCPFVVGRAAVGGWNVTVPIKPAESTRDPGFCNERVAPCSAMLRGAPADPLAILLVLIFVFGATIATFFRATSSIFSIRTPPIVFAEPTDPDILHAEADLVHMALACVPLV